LIMIPSCDGFMQSLLVPVSLSTLHQSPQAEDDDDDDSADKADEQHVRVRQGKVSVISN